MRSLSRYGATDTSMVSMFNDLRSLPAKDQLLLRELIDVLMEAQALQRDGKI